MIRNDANLILDGSGVSLIQNQRGDTCLANFAVHDVNGTLTLQNGYNLVISGDYTRGSAANLDGLPRPPYKVTA